MQPHVGGPPYRGGALKSAYHVRELEVYRLMKLRGRLDIFLSHDWPARIAFAGNTQRLLQRKAFLRKEVRSAWLAHFSSNIIDDVHLSVIGLD